MRYTQIGEVDSHQVDTKMIIKPSDLIRFMQETASNHMRERGLSYSELIEMGKTLILARLSLEIYHDIKKYDEIKIETWRCPIKSVTSDRGFAVVRGEIEVARCLTQWALVDLNTKKIQRARDDDFPNFEMDDAPGLSIPKRFKIRPAERILVDVHRANYGEIDINNHLNNTYYPNMLWSYIPGIEKKALTSMNLRFHKEALLGEEIKIYYMGMGQDKSLDPRAEEIHLFKTYIDNRLNLEGVFGVRRWNSTRKI